MKRIKPVLFNLPISPKLTLEEERDAVLAAQSGDNEATMRLIASLSGWICRVAMRVARDKFSADVVADAIDGFLKAIRHFDPTRGHRLSTYSTYLMGQAIRQGLARDRVIPLSQGNADRAYAVLRVMAHYESAEGHVSEISEQTSLSPSVVKNLIDLFKYTSSPVSMQATPAVMEELCSSQTHPLSPHAFNPLDFSDTLSHAISTLTHDERLVFECFYRPILDGATSPSYRNLAGTIGKSRYETAALIAATTRKLRGAFSNAGW